MCIRDRFALEQAVDVGGLDITGVRQQLAGLPDRVFLVARSGVELNARFSNRFHNYLHKWRQYEVSDNVIDYNSKSREIFEGSQDI